ncbi:hypothetical protein LY56_03170 [Roseinatronobacter thiooxidans]|uniref:Antitoxin FitA-like ribbon-helix-helix domain-containing protein n=1 Tax=Roseinatronobacter thiooxidans TaxID=121821 RepID=A0A2W7QA78_9RHOB|nr:plasmid stabilization protein [Roseinatronobacter thiooxidans]PZX37969.1 hypothetical protein LY56_03170 [Roseinatronobacter thiooxidans]
MASITIRSLDDTVKRRLRVQAAEHGWSMAEGTCEIPREAVRQERPPRNLAHAIRARIALMGGAELELLAHDPMRDLPSFGCA